MLAVANAGFCVGPKYKIGHSAPHQMTDTGSRFECQRNINRPQNIFMRNTVKELLYLNIVVVVVLWLVCRISKR